MDYRVAVARVMGEYAGQPQLLIKAMTTLIETAVDSEKDRLRSELKSEAICTRCKEACKGCEREQAQVHAEVANAEKLAAPAAASLPQFTPDVLAQFAAFMQTMQGKAEAKHLGVDIVDGVAPGQAEPRTNTTLTPRQLAQRQRREREARAKEAQ